MQAGAYQEHVEILGGITSGRAEAKKRWNEWRAYEQTFRGLLQEVAEALSTGIQPGVEQLDGDQLGLRIMGTKGPGQYVDSGAVLRFDMLPCGLVQPVYFPGGLIEAGRGGDVDGEPIDGGVHEPKAFTRHLVADIVRKFCERAVADHWSNTEAVIKKSAP